MIKTLALASLALGAAVLATAPAKADVLLHNNTGRQVVFFVRGQGYAQWRRIDLPAGYNDHVRLDPGVTAARIMVKTRMNGGWVDTITYTVPDGSDLAIRYDNKGAVALFTE